MQNDDIKISVIMPVYNVSDYLRKAVESVLMQSHHNFELFLVDDGSKDDSGKICDEYAKKDERVKVIHQENAGAHNARNNALKSATGKYVCFFDSDDYVNPNMLKDMLSSAEKNGSELVVSGFYINTYYDQENYIVLDYVPYIRNDIEEDNFNNEKEFRKYSYLNFDKNMFYPPWNKLYLLSYLKENDIVFPVTYRDDFPFVLKVIRDIKNVTYLKKQYYNFIRKRSDSETQKYVANFYDKREEEHEEMLELFRYWGLIDDENSFEMISRRYIDRIIECMVNLFNTKCTLKKNEKIDAIKSYLANEHFKTCIVKAKPKKLYLKLMYLPLKLRSAKLCYIMSKIICGIKKKNIKMFSILKTNR